MTENEEFSDVRDMLVYTDGEAHCPRDDCDWWVPTGMEYAMLEHVEKHDDLEEEGDES